MYNVKYEGKKYRVRLNDKFRILTIRFLLFLKRTKRRFFIAVPKNILLYIFMVILWAIFLIITFIAGVAYKSPYSYTIKDAAWDLKAPFFTSVLLAILMVSYQQVVEYKKEIREQYYLYVETLYAFNDLFEPFIKGQDFEYLSFYTSKRVRDTLAYLQRYDFTNCYFDDEHFEMALTDIQEQLREIKVKINGGAILGMHEDRLSGNIREANRLIWSIKGKHEEIKFNIIDQLAMLLLLIIADIRRPWRWDVKNNGKILEILVKYDENNINDNFYYKMQLDQYNFEK